jgi:hypothetical protein
VNCATACKTRFTPGRRERYLNFFAAARLTASSLTLPVNSRIVPNIISGGNCGIGLGKFLLRASLRFC